jgi:hypothetical protein
MSKRLKREAIQEDDILDYATQVVLAVKSEANPNIDNNAKKNGYDYQYDKDAVEKFEADYEWTKDEYADYDNLCTSATIEALLGVIMCLVNSRRPEQKWCWTELAVKPQADKGE